MAKSPQSSAPQHDAPASAVARTVVVACKIPNGLALQLQKPVDRKQDGKGGPITVTYWQKYGSVYYIEGPAYPIGAVPKGFQHAPPIEGGYALTPGVPAAFWEQWVEQHAMADYVTSGAIFAATSRQDVKAMAREREGLRSGLEPISMDVNPKGELTDPRLPKPMSGAVGRIRTEERAET